MILFLKALPVVFLGFHLALALAPPINFPVDKISFLFALEEHLLTRLKWLTKRDFKSWKQFDRKSRAGHFVAHSCAIFLFYLGGEI